MFGFNVLPQQGRFFEKFVGLAGDIRSGSRLLKQMLASDPPDMTPVDAIREIEHACDRRTRSIIDQLNRTFITPLDREDIHALASSLDDVMDAIVELFDQEHDPIAVIKWEEIFDFLEAATSRRRHLQMPRADVRHRLIVMGSGPTQDSTHGV